MPTYVIDAAVVLAIWLAGAYTAGAVILAVLGTVNLFRKTT